MGGDVLRFKAAWWRWGAVAGYVLLAGCVATGAAPVVSRTNPRAAMPAPARTPSADQAVVHTAPVRAGAADARGIEVRPLESAPASVSTPAPATAATSSTAPQVRATPRGTKVAYSESVWNDMKAADQAALAAAAKPKAAEARSTVPAEPEAKTKGAVKSEEKSESQRPALVAAAAKGAAKSEDKAEVRTEAKPGEELKPEVKPEAKTETKTEAKTEPARDAKAEPKSEAKSDGSAEPGREWGWPSAGKVLQTYDGSAHKGLLIAGKAGDPVLAAADGQVIFSGNGPRGYGNLVIVKHPKDLVSVYAQNRSLAVKEGQQVKRGQKLAELGEPAAASPRLHFEIRQRGKPVDPARFLPRR